MKGCQCQQNRLVSFVMFLVSWKIPHLFVLLQKVCRPLIIHRWHASSFGVTPHQQLMSLCGLSMSSLFGFDAVGWL